MNKKVIFLHIPKAAGSTLRSIIRRQYPDHQVHQITTTPTLQESINRFKKLSDKQKKKIHCLMGYGVFGLDNHLNGSTEYVTMFRKPVSRVISNYYFVRRDSGHRLHEQVTKRNLSLRKYVTSGLNKALDNQIVRNVSGQSTNEASEEMLSKAKKNIDNHFGVVGLVEKFDKSIILMKKKFGWRDVSYVKKNVTKERPKKDEINKDVLECIKKRNKLDLKLYNYAEKKFTQALHRVDLDRELRNLRFRCWVRSSTAKILRPLKMKAKEKARKGLAALGLR